MNKSFKLSQNWPDSIVIGIAAIIFSYTCIRSILLSIVNDEAVTYFFFVSIPIKDIYLLNAPDAHLANNHLLNTLLIKLFTNFLGNYEFVLRIPALLGHVLYMSAVYRILRLFLR